MKKLLFVLVMLIGSLAFAQDNINEQDSTNAKVDIKPTFPGGETAMFDYLRKNIVYPKKARINNIQGVVVISFIIQKNGQLRNLKILKSLSPECDAEVMRVVNAMPKWEPGEKNGEAINSKFNLPVFFKLNDKKRSRKNK